MTDQDKAIEALISEQAVNSFSDAPNARYKQIMQSLVRHLHAFVSDVELTEQEWFEGIRFLTETGHKCDGLVRQEFILLSDTLGVSMLVDAINHRHSANATETTVFGPFYIEGMPERDFGENMAFTAGETALVRGRVVDTQGNPLAGAVLDVWQTAENGMYSGQDTEQPFGNLRGRYRTDCRRLFRDSHDCPGVLPDSHRWSGGAHAQCRQPSPVATCASAFHDRCAGLSQTGHPPVQSR